MNNMEKMEVTYTINFRGFFEGFCDVLIKGIFNSIPSLSKENLQCLKNAESKGLSRILPRPLIKGPFFEIRASKKKLEIIFSRNQVLLLEEFKQMILVKQLCTLPEIIQMRVLGIEYDVVFYCSDYLLTHFLDSLTRNKPDDWSLCFNTRERSFRGDIKLKESYVPWRNKRLIENEILDALKIEKQYFADFTDDCSVDKYMHLFELFCRKEKELILERI